MDLDDLNVRAADLEREYREAVAPALDAVVLAADRALRAAVAARDQLAAGGTDDALKEARVGFAAAVDGAVAAVATARGVRTKALRKAGLR